MTTAPKDVTLTCRSELVSDRLRLHYSVSSRAAADLYVLDASPVAAAQGRDAVADSSSFFVCYREPSAGLILKGIAPLPVDRDIKARIIPLGTKVSPGNTLARSVDLSLPLLEQSPYYPPLEPNAYEQVVVATVLLRVQFLRSTAEGFEAEASAWPDLFIVRSKNTVGHAESLDCELSVGDLRLLRRKGAFSRV